MRSFLLMFCLFPITGWTQTVINTEELRLQGADKKVVGLLDVNFGMTRNKAGLSVRPSADLRLEMLGEASRLIALAGYQLTRFSNLDVPESLPKNFTNKGFGHLRYNREVSNTITWEAFGQIQYDEIQEIDNRILLGTGPRFQLAKNDSTNAYLYLGTLYMYEYEETSDNDNLIVYNKHHRMSNYLSGGIKFNEFVGLGHITYFQPRLDRFGDFRVSTITNLSARISKTLSYSIGFQFIYDSKPPMTVPNVMYDMTAGLAFRW